MKHPTTAARAIALGVAVAAVCTTLTIGAAWAKGAVAKAAPPHTMVVRSGDGGWWQIAHTHGTTLPRLLAANHATAATPVKVGDRIRLPADTKGAKSARTPAAHTASKQK
jgi:hypothetical protein